LYRVEELREDYLKR